MWRRRVFACGRPKYEREAMKRDALDTTHLHFDVLCSYYEPTKMFRNRDGQFARNIQKMTGLALATQNT